MLASFYVVVYLKWYWYQTQMFSVKWYNNVSKSLNASNRVTQGGIISPLFNVFKINDLSSILLNSAKIGCHLNDVWFNHLHYTEDSVIVSPPPLGYKGCYIYVKNLLGKTIWFIAQFCFLLCA